MSHRLWYLQHCDGDSVSKILRILEASLHSLLPNQLHQTSISQDVATDKVHWGRLSVHQQEAIKQTFKVAFSKLWAGNVLETGSRDWDIYGIRSCSIQFHVHSWHQLTTHLSPFNKTVIQRFKSCHNAARSNVTIFAAKLPVLWPWYVE